MRNSKKIIVPIIIILILLLMAGGVFAYIYIETDMLKTDRQLFFKYFAQITAEEGFIDSRIEQYNQKKNETPYENLGEVTINVEYPESELDDIIEKVNDLSITYSGAADIANQFVEENVEIDYGKDVVFPLTYKQTGDKYGVKIEKISKKFIAIRDEKLDELLTNIIGEDSMGTMENKVSSLKDIGEQLTKGIEFSEDEKKQLEDIYSPVLEQQLIEQSFSSVKTEQNNSYIMHLSSEQIRKIIIKLLETTKEQPFIINKINDKIQEIDEDAELIEVNAIDDLIEDINEIDIENIPNLKITLIQKDKQLEKIIIESGEAKISITKSQTEDEVSYNIETDATESSFYINMKIKGLQEMNSIQENYEIGFGIIADEESIKYDYIINSSINFKESVLIEELDKDSALFLNDYNEEKVTSFLEQVGERLSKINKNQMKELGLEEDENPLLYSNPVTMLVVEMMEIFNNSANEVLDN